MTLDPFYPIVDSAAWVARLVAEGARLVQLRIKDLPDEKAIAARDARTPSRGMLLARERRDAHSQRLLARLAR